MKTNWFKNNEIKISKAAMIVVFLALIRCILEVFRLKYIFGNTLNIDQITLFVLGALISAISAFCLVILYFYNKNKAIILMAVLTIFLLILVKYYNS